MAGQGGPVAGDDQQGVVDPDADADQGRHLVGEVRAGHDVGGDADQRDGDSDAGQGDHDGQAGGQDRAEHHEQHDQGRHHPDNVTFRGAAGFERVSAEGHRQAGRTGQMLDGGGRLAGVAARVVGQRERGIGHVTAGGHLDLPDAGHAGLAADPGQELLGGGPMAGDAGEHGGVALTRLGGELGGQDVLGGLRVGPGQAAAVGPPPGQARTDDHGGHDQGDPGQEDTAAVPVAGDGETAEHGSHAPHRKNPGPS